MLKCQQPAGKKIDYFIAVTPGFTDSSLYQHYFNKDFISFWGDVTKQNGKICDNVYTISS